MKLLEGIIDKDEKGVYLQIPGDKKYFTDDCSFMNAYYAHEAINQLYEKDHRIAVLEKENQNLKLELEIGRPLIAALEEKAISLPYDRNIAVLEKALDLACESVYYPNARPFDRNTSNAKYFIDQAEKELKDAQD